MTSTNPIFSCSLYIILFFFEILNPYNFRYWFVSLCFPEKSDKLSFCSFDNFFGIIIGKIICKNFCEFWRTFNKLVFCFFTIYKLKFSSYYPSKNFRKKFRCLIDTYKKIFAFRIIWVYHVIQFLFLWVYFSVSRSPREKKGDFEVEQQLL